MYSPSSGKRKRGKCNTGKFVEKMTAGKFQTVGQRSGQIGDSERRVHHGTGDHSSAQQGGKLERRA